MRLHNGYEIDYFLNGQHFAHYLLTGEDLNSQRLIGNTVIGMDNGYASYYFGDLDDVRIYNRALSEAEVAALYELEKPKTTLETGLVAYYPFNGNANDESGYGNNGTVTGATLVEDRNGGSSKAYSFDGDDFIISTSEIELTQNKFTLSLWANPNSS